MAREVIASKRNIAYIAQFRRTADKRALMGDGASAWASGSQLCMGTKPTLVPYPTATKTNASFSSSRPPTNPGAASIRVPQSSAD